MPMFETQLPSTVMVASGCSFGVQFLSAVSHANPMACDWGLALDCYGHGGLELEKLLATRPVAQAFADALLHRFMLCISSTIAPKA
jgi:hypothetical protein